MYIKNNSRRWEGRVWTGVTPIALPPFGVKTTPHPSPLTPTTMKPKKYNADGNKWCNNCKAYHHPSVFGENKKATDGLNYSCRQSINEKNCPMPKPVESEPIPNYPVELHSLKLTRQYQYQRPDAYDLYINNINSARK